MSLSPRTPSLESGTLLSVGLIGCGERGRALAAAIARVGNLRLAMAMDADHTVAQALGSQYGISWTTSLDQMLDSPVVDAVIVCTPHRFHAPQAIRAAEAGKHVVVEKPLATSYADATAVLRAAQRAGVRLSVMFSHRYLPHVQRAKEIIQAGALGELLGVFLIFQRDGLQSGWRSSREASGGGVLINQLIHYLDWLRYLPGKEVREVSARQAVGESLGDVEDTVCLWLRYENGALGTVNGALCARGTGSAGDLVEFRLWGRDGHISLTPPYEFYSLRAIDGKRPGQWHRLLQSRGRAERDVEYLRRFAAQVLRGGEPEVRGEDGLAVQAIVEAAYRSVEEGNVVHVESGQWAFAGS